MSAKTLLWVAQSKIWENILIVFETTIQFSKEVTQVTEKWDDSHKGLNFFPVTLLINPNENIYHFSCQNYIHSQTLVSYWYKSSAKKKKKKATNVLSKWIGYIEFIIKGITYYF